MHSSERYEHKARTCGLSVTKQPRLLQCIAQQRPQRRILTQCAVVQLEQAIEPPQTHLRNNTALQPVTVKSQSLENVTHVLQYLARLVQHAVDREAQANGGCAYVRRELAKSDQLSEL